MNHSYFRILSLCWTFFLYQCIYLTAQSTPKDSIYSNVDFLPIYPDGTEKMTEFIKSNLSNEIMLQIAKDKVKNIYNLPVLVSFVVEKDGALSNITTSSDTLSDLTAEAIRIVRNMPKWSPGKKDGQIVRTHLTIPVSFYLDILKLAKTTNINRINRSGVDSEDGGLLYGINYQKSFLHGKIGNHLEQKMGLTFDLGLLGYKDDGWGPGFGLYYTLLRTSVIEPFERRQGIWDVARNSSLNEIGIKGNFRIKANKRIEFFPTLQMGTIWHRRAKKYVSDSGLGIGTVGYSIGLGLNLFWFIHETDNYNYDIIQFSLLGQQVFMNEPLKGPIISLSIGYAFLVADF
ncbi:MAG: energy transducer TonB [Saprospiraceae bacterium]